jgi:hypothetical protein
MCDEMTSVDRGEVLGHMESAHKEVFEELAGEVVNVDSSDVGAAAASSSAAAATNRKVNHWGNVIKMSV